MKLRDTIRLALRLGAAFATLPVLAQQPAAPPAASASTPPSLSSSLGVYVFPAKSQQPNQQAADEATCFGWAKTQTGFDPLLPPPQATAQTPPVQASTDAASGARAKGALGGAAAGAAIGAIAGDAGKGAAIGATAGTLKGGRERRQAAREAQTQQQQAQAAVAQQAAAREQAQKQFVERKAGYNKAFAACLEAKGYSVK